MVPSLGVVVGILAWSVIFQNANTHFLAVPIAGPFPQYSNKKGQRHTSHWPQLVQQTLAGIIYKI